MNGPQHQTYSPFTAFDERNFILTDAVIIKQNKENTMCINNFVVHKTIGKGSYAQVRLGYDVFLEEQVALRIINRQLMARKCGQQLMDKMLLNALKISSTISNKYIITLKEFIYSNIYFPTLGEKISYIPISHKLFQRFEEPPIICGRYDPLPLEECDDSCRSTTPRSQQSAQAFINSAIFVLEYANRGSLDKFINSNGSSEERLKDILLQVINALSVFHHHGIIFNDLKSDNILLVQDKLNKINAKLTDFDTATILEEQTLNYINFADIENVNDIVNKKFVVTDPLAENYQYVTDIICTPAIAAPESRNKFSYFKGFLSDVWQYGVTLYNVITNMRINKAVPKSSKEYQQLFLSFGQNFADLITFTLEQNSALRYDVDDIIEHPWFVGDFLSIESFHKQICQEKSRKTFIKQSKKMRRGSFSGFDCPEVIQSNYMSFIDYQYEESIRHVNYLTKFTKFDMIYSMRSNQSEFLQDFAPVLRQVTVPLSYSTNRLRKNKSNPLLLSRQTKFDVYNLNITSNFAQDVVTQLINKGQMNRIILDHLIIQDIPNVSVQNVYLGAQVIYEINFFIRYCNFHITESYYQQGYDDLDQQLSNSQSVTSIGLDLTKRAVLLKQNNQIQLSSRSIETTKSQFMPPTTPARQESLNKWKELEESDDDDDLFLNRQDKQQDIKQQTGNPMSLNLQIINKIPKLDSSRTSTQTNEEVVEWIDFPNVAQKSYNPSPRLKLKSLQQCTTFSNSQQVPLISEIKGVTPQNLIQHEAPIPKVPLLKITFPEQIINQTIHDSEKSQNLNVIKKRITPIIDSKELLDSQRPIQEQQLNCQNLQQDMPELIDNTSNFVDNQQNNDLIGKSCTSYVSASQKSRKIPLIQFEKIQIPKLSLDTKIISSQFQQEMESVNQCDNTNDSDEMPIQQKISFALQVFQPRSSFDNDSYGSQLLRKTSTSEFYPIGGYSASLAQLEQRTLKSIIDVDLVKYDSQHAMEKKTVQLLPPTSISKKISQGSFSMLNNEYGMINNASVIHKYSDQKLETEQFSALRMSKNVSSSSECKRAQQRWTGIVQNDNQIEEEFTPEQQQLLALVGKNLQFRTNEPIKRIYSSSSGFGSSSSSSSSDDSFNESIAEAVEPSFGQAKVPEVIFDLSFSNSTKIISQSLDNNTDEIDGYADQKHSLSISEKDGEVVSADKPAVVDVWNKELGALGALFNVVKATGPVDYYVDGDQVDYSIGDCSSESSCLQID